MEVTDTFAIVMFIIGLVVSGIAAYLAAVILAQMLAGLFRRDK